jgi:parallel beta-helix repeat protein/predicted outer membrane repeat protein
MDHHDPTPRRGALGRPLASAILIAAGVLVAGSASFVQSAGATTSGGTLYVSTTGSDTGTCRLSSHPCQTITYALTQATADSTIKVAGGTYAEQVVVSGSQHVTIAGGWVPKGSSASPTVVDPTSVPSAEPDSDSSQSQYAIIDAQPGATLNLSKVTVNGDGAQSQFNSCADDYVGVYYHDASGTMSTDTVTNVELPTADFGCQDGLGVYVTSDTGLSNVSMTHLTVTNYDKNGITCDDETTTCSIAKSTVTGIGPTPLIAQNGIQAANDGQDHAGPSVTITGNKVTGNTYTDPQFQGGTAGFTQAAGILLIDSNNTTVSSNVVQGNDANIYAYQDGQGAPYPAWMITNNHIGQAVNNSGTDCGGTCDPVPFGDGIGDGLVLDSVTNVTATGNTSDSDAEYGFALAGAIDSTLSNNTTTTSGGGIYVGGDAPGYVGANSTGNTVDNNKANGNTHDGIFADTTASNNTFGSNSLHSNGGFDAHDISTGAGTAGTANTWTGDTCKPAHDSSPAGLC